MSLLTVPEVAQRLRVHEMTVRRHIRSGKLRATRIGRRYRVREADLEALLLSGANQDREFATLHAWVSRELTQEERDKRQRIYEEMSGLRERSKPLGVSTQTLVRIARRADELAYGAKTWDELVAEES